MKRTLLVKRCFYFLACLVLAGCGDNSTQSNASSTQGNASTTQNNASSREVASAKATIAVLAHSDFLPDRTQAQKGTLIGLPDVLADRMIEHLTNSQRFSPVERTALRKLVLEQRFGKKLTDTYLDRTLDKAISAMEVVDGGAVSVAADRALPPGYIPEGQGAVGTIGTLADYSDTLKDFQDLGTAAGADYLVLGNLEKLNRTTQETAVPFSSEGRTVRKNVTNARLRLRVVDVRSGTVVGAASIQTQIAESLFEGKKTNTDEFSFYDHLAQLAASKVLDVTFPAKIVSIDPLVISRGTNDGAHEGDTYIVKREGKEIKDGSGVVIARLKSDIGKVGIVTAQDTVSVVETVAGGGFKQGDLAYLDVKSGSAPKVVASVSAIPLSGRTVTKTQGVPKLPRLAVGLVKSGSTESKGKEAEKNTPIFTDTLISRLTQTKRFQLIDRQEVDQLLTEQLAQSLVENRDMPSAIGTLKGADYLVYGSLASFSVEDKVVKLPGSTRTFVSKVGYVEGNMRIVDARSGDILESRKISVEEKIDISAEGTRKVTALADAYAEQVTMLLMNAIYPIKVAAVGGDGTVYINRGDDGGLYTGELLDAFRPGQPIIDPDTGIQLGVEETVIGQVTVTEVEDARSKGAVTVAGSGISKGDILKRMIHNRDKRSAKAARNTAPVTTGAVLPGGSQQAKPPASNKFTLAVGLLKVNSSARTNGFGAGNVKRMNDDLMLKLTNTNRFVVMDRQEIDQILDEKAFETAAAGGDIESRLRELAGADYLIHGEIANFYTSTERTKVPYLDEEQVKVTGVAEGMFRVVNVHTGAIVGADKVRYSVNASNNKDKTQMMSNLMDAFTTKGVAAIVLRLFPIKVMGIASDGVLYINRGGDAGLEKGTVFDVMRPGEVLKDPDTGITFGSAETKVATVEVLRVEANRARARLVSGNAAQVGDILYKSEVAKTETKTQFTKPAW